MKKYLTLEEIDAYAWSFALSNYIWDLVLSWGSFPKWTCGKQLVEAADSIPANIAEGWGRYHKKDKIRFYRYSFGSMKETRDWVRKGEIRHLISAEEVAHILGELDRIQPAINQLIQFTNQKLKY